MATKIRDGSYGKMKFSLSSSQANVLRERPSAERNTSSANKKPQPHYLTPTLSSSGVEVCKYGRKHASEYSTGKHLVRRLSLEKPTPKSQPLKGPASACSPKDKQLKTSISLPRTVIAARSFEKETKSTRNVRPSLLKNEIVALKKAEVSSPLVASTVASARITDKPSPTVLDELEKKEFAEKELVETVSFEVEKEQGINEMVLAGEQTDTRFVQLGSDIGGPKKLEDCGSFVPSPLEGLEEKQQTVADKINNENDSEPAGAIKKNEETDEKVEGEEKCQNMILVGHGEEDKAQKLSFRQGKYINVDEEACEELHQVKLSKADTARRRSTEETRPEAENVVLKKQEVQGKKESVDYNDVIEATTSKLAGQRKNKVLALAGAFETVISLHESEGLPSNKKA